MYEYHTPLSAWLKTEAIPKINVKDVLISHSLLKRINGENKKDEIGIQILNGNVHLFLLGIFCFAVCTF